VRFENEPEALFTVVPAEGGGLAVIAASDASHEVYGFDASEDEWSYPVGVHREVAAGGAAAAGLDAGGRLDVTQWGDRFLQSAYLTAALVPGSARRGRCCHTRVILINTFRNSLNLKSTGLTQNLGQL
jgi:hypothetical protein